MTEESPKIEERIRWAGFLVGAGLAIQGVTLIASHPLAFVAFLGIGVPITAAGVVLYLWSLVSGGNR
ncbi:MAG TPA: hypothetical protein VH639_07045 [Bryobacteraceae bacterium]|jgi:hypothetical protein